MTRSMLEKVNEYVDHKRKLGYILHTESYMLKNFGQFADSIAFGKPLSVKLAVRWAVLPKSKKTYHAKRLDALRSFARYLIVEDPATERIPTGILGKSSSRTTPYIFSEREIYSLMTTATFVRAKCLNNFTFSTYIGLLASTGLRVGEALRLPIKSINWQEGTIIVKDSKKLPMRLVPIDSSVIRALYQYKECRTCVFPNSNKESFFLSSNGKALSYNDIRYGWRRLLSKTGVGRTRKQLPRLYDFRHTFACRCLFNAYKNNQDIEAAVHTLSVYLGHSTVHNTFWYLNNTPELMAISGKRFETFINTSK